MKAQEVSSILASNWEQTNNVVTDTLIGPLVALLHQFSEEAGEKAAVNSPSCLALMGIKTMHPFLGPTRAGIEQRIEPSDLALEICLLLAQEPVFLDQSLPADPCQACGLFVIVNIMPLCLDLLPQACNFVMVALLRLSPLQTWIAALDQTK